MGVDIQTYRGRIGCFSRNFGTDVLTFQYIVNFTQGLKTIGAVVFIGILLLLAGIEQNPGPISESTSKQTPANATILKVSGLPKGIGIDSLMNTFDKTTRHWGSVLKVVIDENESSALVEFEEAEALQLVLRKRPIQIDGKDVAVEIYIDEGSLDEGSQMDCAGELKDLQLGSDFEHVKKSGAVAKKTSATKRSITKRFRKSVGGFFKALKGRKETNIYTRAKTSPTECDEKEPDFLHGTESWDTCIERISESDAKILLEKDILPSKSELNKASCVFGRGSTIFSNICSVISQHIKKMSENVIDVCPSYKADCTSIVFIVFLKRTSQFFIFKDYECYKIYENEPKADEEQAAVYENKVKTRNQSDEKVFEKLRKCINKNADDLLKRHSNLNVILPSLKKSVGYKSGQHKIIEEPCIALFVTVKGLIPFAEERFKKDIDGFRTDVLGGEFEPYFGGPNEFHEHLKIGLAIQANIENGSIGTLGGFIEHPQHGLCGITCAHVVYTHDELKMIKENTPFKMDKLVYQPKAYHTSFEKVVHDTSFGKVVHVVFNEGDDRMSGMEVAIFSIQDRKPKDGSFPKVLNDIKAGFDDDHPLCFNSGDICEMANIKPRTEVYKLGISSGITRGSFELQGAAVRRRQMQGHCQSFGFYLKDQIVILPIGHDPFAEPGDSGALVLMEGEQDSVAIGIVEGGMHGFVFVTPICDILRAAGCTELKMCQFKTEKKAYSTDSGVGMDVSSCFVDMSPYRV